MLEKFITFALSNFVLTFFVLGVIAALLSLIGKSKPLTANVIVEAFFSYFLLFSIGFTFFYNFIVHVFFGEMAAAFIGWQQSPFQAEVGFASLGMAVLGFIGFRADFSFRCAAILAPLFFCWGAACGHVYQMIVAHNFAPGNAGVMFWADILLPALGLCLLWLSYKYPPDAWPSFR